MAELPSRVSYMILQTRTYKTSTAYSLRQNNKSTHRTTHFRGCSNQTPHQIQGCRTLKFWGCTSQPHPQCSKPISINASLMQPTSKPKHINTEQTFTHQPTSLTNHQHYQIQSQGSHSITTHMTTQPTRVLCLCQPTNSSIQCTMKHALFATLLSPTGRKPFIQQ